MPRDGGFLLWSDVPANTISKWSPGQAAAAFMKPSGFTGVGKYSAEPGSNGLTLDKQGRLIAAEHGDRRISRYDWTGGKRTIADNWQGKRFNSPNDVIVKSNGDIYFTDPIYGLPERETDKTRETDFCGVYRWSAKTGEVTLLTKELSRPNGLAFSPDEKLLYVANSDPVKAIWMVYPVQADGTIGAGKVFKDVTSMVGDKNPGLPDGMKHRRQGQPVRQRARRHPCLRARRHAARPHRDRPGDGELRLRRRRQRPLSHRRHVHRPREDEDERRGTLKIATWNVNGLRARQAQLEAWLAETQPDVLCLQEIKASPAQLGLLADIAGYHCYWHGDKGYSGVALLVSERIAPDCPSYVVPPFDFEARIVTARLPELAVASVYVPNGGKDFEAKLRFLGDLEAFAASHARDGVPLVICGDLNVARTDADIHPKERKLNQIGARPDERAQFERVIAHGPDRRAAHAEPRCDRPLHLVAAVARPAQEERRLADRLRARLDGAARAHGELHRRARGRHQRPRAGHVDLRLERTPCPPGAHDALRPPSRLRLPRRHDGLS